MKTKLCTNIEHNVELPISQFNRNSSKIDGLDTYCRECRRDYNRRYYQTKAGRKEKVRALADESKRKIKEYVIIYLSTHPCVDCGESDPVVLEFDHRETSNKIDSVAKIVSSSFSIQKVIAEIAKCDVRCANCHRRKTAKTFNYYTYKE